MATPTSNTDCTRLVVKSVKYIFTGKRSVLPHNHEEVRYIHRIDIHLGLSLCHSRNVVDTQLCKLTKFNNR